MPGDMLNPAEAAEFFGVTRQTLARWARQGALPFVTLPSGSRRYRRADLERLANGDGTAA